MVVRICESGEKVGLWKWGCGGGCVRVGGGDVCLCVKATATKLPDAKLLKLVDYSPQTERSIRQFGARSTL